MYREKEEDAPAACIDLRLRSMLCCEEKDSIVYGEVCSWSMIEEEDVAHSWV